MKNLKEATNIGLETELNIYEGKVNHTPECFAHKVNERLAAIRAEISFRGLIANNLGQLNSSSDNISDSE